MRFFNTLGPVRPEDHYCVPPLERLGLGNVLRLIREKKYFVLHAPRQTGKTSALFALRDHLNSGAEGEYRCVYTSFETGRAAGDDTERAARAILAFLARQARATLGDGFVHEIWREILADYGPDDALVEVLSRWSESDPTPLVLLVDEADALSGATMASMLHQLRGGYNLRPRSFPQSVALCGMRDVRDYRVENVSPFNIAESMRLGDLGQGEVASLLGQHTEETGQAFEPEALQAVWTQTRGQPWLVNALAYETCFEMTADEERPITAQDIALARERIIARRDTHIDNLYHRLSDERTRKVIATILTGGGTGSGYSDDDLQYVRDLGLVAADAPLRLANPIYAEVVPRTLNHTAQGEMDIPDTAWFIDADGDLDVSKLLGEFQAFFREHSEHWRGRFAIVEAWPQLLLQAFLQRVVNHRGRVEREYAAGAGRTDLTLVWPLPEGQGGSVGERKHVVECKVGSRGMERLVARAITQTVRYMDACAAASGHVVVIDPTDGRRWEDKAGHRFETAATGEVVEVWFM